jgi:hypothetical protein
VFLFSLSSDPGVFVQHFFMARLVSLDESARGEFDVQHLHETAPVVSCWFLPRSRSRAAVVARAVTDSVCQLADVS